MSDQNVNISDQQLVELAVAQRKAVIRGAVAHLEQTIQYAYNPSPANTVKKYENNLILARQLVESAQPQLSESLASDGALSLHA